MQVCKVICREKVAFTFTIKFMDDNASGKFIGHIVCENSNQNKKVQKVQEKKKKSQTRKISSIGRRNTMTHTRISRKRQRRIVSNIMVGLLLLGSVIFIGVCPPIGMLCIALVLFS